MPTPTSYTFAGGQNLTKTGTPCRPSVQTIAEDRSLLAAAAAAVSDTGNLWSLGKTVGTRPGRVRFFKFYRVGRVLDASGT
eukprot:gene15949-biopygen21752